MKYTILILGAIFEVQDDSEGGHRGGEISPLYNVSKIWNIYVILDKLARFIVSYIWEINMSIYE